MSAGRTRDLVTDVAGASEAGIETVLLDRACTAEAPEATYVLSDLAGLPEIVEGP